MFTKLEKNIYVDSAESSISDDIEESQRPIAKKLFNLVQLISQKFGLEDVLGRLNNDNTVSIVLFNGLSGIRDSGMDEENKRPVELLNSLGGKVDAKEPARYSYYSNTIVTLEHSKLDSAIDALKLLNDEPVAERFIARC